MVSALPERLESSFSLHQASEASCSFDSTTLIPEQVPNNHKLHRGGIAVRRRHSYSNHRWANRQQNTFLSLPASVLSDIVSRQLNILHIVHAGWFMEYTRGGKKVQREGERLRCQVTLYCS